MGHLGVGLIAGLLVAFFAPAAWADGAVYAMTNALKNNEVIVYHRAHDVTLTFMQRIATGGGGSGIQLDPTDSLGSQGALVFDRLHSRLFACQTTWPSPTTGAAASSTCSIAGTARSVPSGSTTTVPLP